MDATGRRFVDEGRGDVAVSNELARSDDPSGATLIFDHAAWQANKDDLSFSASGLPSANPWLQQNGADVVNAESTEALADMLGIDRTALCSTVARYNRTVADGSDTGLAVARTGKPMPLVPPLYEDFFTGATDQVISADMQTRVRKLAIANRIELTSTVMLDPKRLDSTTYLGLRIQIRGEMSNVQALLYAIESGKPYFFVDRAVFSVENSPRSSATPLRLPFRAELDIYGAKLGADGGRK